MTQTTFTPTTEDELSDIIASASAPFCIVGGSTRHTPAGHQRLSTAGLSGVRLYEPGALTLVAGAGTPMAEINALLADNGQRLPFEPMDHRAVLGTTGEPTLGGMIALNHCGPRRVQAGSARDMLLGLRFVDGSGRIVKNGGRVMKNVTGYDIARLHCGARGKLGVITEISLKVLPLPERTATMALAELSPIAAVAGLSKALGSPFEVNGAAWHQGRILLRIEGFNDSISYRADQLSGLLPGLTLVDENPWDDLRDARFAAQSDRDIWRVSLRASNGAKAAERLMGMGVDVTLDWGGALLWASADRGFDLRSALGGLHGHATRLRGAGDAPALEPAADGVAQLTTALQKAYDPRGLFNG